MLALFLMIDKNMSSKKYYRIQTNVNKYLQFMKKEMHKKHLYHLQFKIFIVDIFF